MYTKQFTIGQKIHCSLYGGMDGYITEIIGEQSPDTCKTLGGGIGVMGGRATLMICFKDHFSDIPESLARSSVQWTVYDTIISASELDKKIAAAQAAIDKAEQDRINKATAKKVEELRQRTAPEYKHLTPISGDTVGIAKNIRAELKKSFPSVKFSVKTQRHSCINVTWTDGPCTDAVDAALANFDNHAGSNMDDSVNYKNHAWIFGCVNYLFCRRQDSETAIRDAIERINKYYGVNGTFEQSKQWGALPEIYSNGRSNGRDFEEEIHKVLSGKKDYEAIERHREREAEVKSILSTQFGFVGYFYKQSSTFISVHLREDYQWSIGSTYDYPVMMSDDYTTPAQTKAEQINTAYDAEVIRHNQEREARELRQLELSRDIIPLSIEYHNRLLTVTFPSCNKNDTLEFNDQQILDNPNSQNCEVRKLIRLSDDDFKRLGESLLNDRPELLAYECTSYIDDKYLVDVIEQTPQYYEAWRVHGITTVIEVRCSNDCFYIDTSGYDYARYVGRDAEGMAKLTTLNIISQLSSELTH